jgi:sugar phosphate isomerase/epimerase
MIGITSVTFRNKTVDEILSFAKETRIDCIEWGGDLHVPPTDTNLATLIGNKTRKAGLSVCSYGSYYYLGADMDILPVLETAKALRTNRVRIWAGKIASAHLTNTSRQKYVLEAKRIADLAAKYNIELCFEYHRGSLTDCADSAKKLMQEIEKKNVFLYWQPNPEIGEVEKLEELATLQAYIKTIHCFYWTGIHTRHPLQEGRQNWDRYLLALTNKDLPFLLEFCQEDSFENAAKDLKTLREIVVGQS